MRYWPLENIFIVRVFDMVAINLPASDPTLDEIHRLYLEKVYRQNQERAKRKAASARYIGASKIGHECSRHIYYDMTGAPVDPPHSIWGDAGLLAAEDGHRAEPVMSERLRMVQGIELHTHDANGLQYGFDWGFMKGNYDGVIRGLLQAPKTWHIHDHKRANAKKFNRLRALVKEGEKSALQKWDKGYYAQQVIYMDAEDLTRSYLTCSTDGFADVTSVRTDANPKYAAALRSKAQRIVAATEPPERAGKDADAPVCMFCPHKGVCHGTTR